MQNEVIYSWERLPIFEFTNQFARLLGRLLVSLPTRFHIQIHNLIGQAVVMADAIPGGHRDIEPGADPVPVEERRAWLKIGYTASITARDLLTELGRVATRSRPDVTVGLKLLSQIETGFQDSLDSLEATPSPARVRC